MRNNFRENDFCFLVGNVGIGKNVHVAIFYNVAGSERDLIMEDFSGLAYGINVFLNKIIIQADPQKIQLFP